MLGIVISDCGEPDVTHGHYVGSTLYGGTASTQCDNGYEGDASITCTTAGTWGPIPDCTPKSEAFFKTKGEWIHFPGMQLSQNSFVSILKKKCLLKKESIKNVV